MSCFRLSRALLCDDCDLLTDEPSCPKCGTRVLALLVHVWPGATAQAPTVTTIEALQNQRIRGTLQVSRE